jgi:hypothetical protein
MEMHTIIVVVVPHLLVMKGAPEKLLECCDTIYSNGTEKKLGDDMKAAFNEVYPTLGGLVSVFWASMTCCCQPLNSLKALNLIQRTPTSPDFNLWD